MKIKDAIRKAMKGNRYQSYVDMFPVVISLTGSSMKLPTFEREFRRYLHLIPHRVKERAVIDGAIYHVFIKQIGAV